MEIKLLSGALGAEISGLDIKDTSDINFKKINDLLLEHKVIFFRDQKITLCSSNKLLILLKFSSDVSLRSIPEISAPKAPDNNFISII